LIAGAEVIRAEMGGSDATAERHSDPQQEAAMTTFAEGFEQTVQ
jgi:hypothetical protein